MFKKTAMTALGLFLASIPASAAFNFDAPAANDLGEELSALDTQFSEPESAAVRTATGEVLVPAKKIQLTVLEDSVDLSGYSAAMSVNCSYKAGLFWPESHPCGNLTVPVELTQSGELLVPAIEAFEGLRGRKIDNFDMGISLTRKDDPEDYLFSMNVRGKDDFKAYAAGNPEFRLLKMNGTRVKVLVEGRELAGSPLSREPRAMLLGSVSVEYKAEDGIMLVTPLTTLHGFDNRQHGYERESLEDFRELVLEPGVFVEKAGEHRRLELSVSLRLENEAALPTLWQSRTALQKTVGGLEAVTRVDLRKAR